MRFLHNVLIVWLVMLVLCSSAMIYGRASNQPNELQELGFSTCDGDPCFMGIVPGKTKWEEAMHILRPLVITEVRARNETYADVKFGQYPMTVYGSNEEIVTGLEFAFDAPLKISLATVFRQYSNPCAIGIMTGTWKILYPSMSLDFFYRFRSN